MGENTKALHYRPDSESQYGFTGILFYCKVAIRAISLELPENHESGIMNQESFILGKLQYMQLTKGCIQFLLYILYTLIWVVGKTICLEQTHIN